MGKAFGVPPRFPSESVSSRGREHSVVLGVVG